jgi:hypothetical protein
MAEERTPLMIFLSLSKIFAKLFMTDNFLKIGLEILNLNHFTVEVI